MKYIISWTVPQSTFNAAVAQFLETAVPTQGRHDAGALAWNG